MAQNARWSIGLHGGSNYSVMSIPGSFTFFGGGGIRYAVNKHLSLEGLYDIGELKGEQTVSNFVGQDIPSDFASFHTKYAMYSGNLLFNLSPFFKLRSKLYRFNPYFILGGSQMSSDVVAELADKRTRVYNELFYTGYAGLQFSYFINAKMDVNIRSIYCYTQTLYLDGIWRDQNFDGFISTSIGINYHIGASNQKMHIDWYDLVILKKLPDGKIILPRRPRLKPKRTVLLANGPQKVLEIIPYPVKLLDSALIQSIAAINYDSLKKASALEADSQVVKSASVKPDENAYRNNSTTPPATPIPSGASVASAPVQTYQPSGNLLVPAAAVGVIAAAKPGKESKGELQTKEISKPKKQESHLPKPEKVVKPSTAAAVMIITKPDLRDSTDTVRKEELSIKDVQVPVSRYNVIVASYTSKKYAMIYRNKLRKRGFNALIFKSSPNSKLLRVSIHSDENKQNAIAMLRKTRRELVKDAWIHVYNGK